MVRRVPQPSRIGRVAPAGAVSGRDPHYAKTIEVNGKRYPVVLVRTDHKKGRTAVKARLDDGMPKWFEVIGQRPTAKIVEYLTLEA